ncbi:uncharacterized protein FTJAE_7625 [Fusarium tjaetaba]|uniref:Uncharacterized protein n=1 Tax=Fusarium tjaetaba TaxID=1567544 RepID=A0A8H5RFW4_9HYPO|nr:uncharacterized protein FTJAE_7625 [Fusarium tjaetaba]KAF5632293.1 hypothetical protein FTJAE_7625 [Fusarium tjaetaba]
MSSKAEIQRQLALLRRQIEEVEKEINISAPYKEHVKQQMAMHHTTMTDSDDEAVSKLAMKNYEFYCGILEKVLKKEQERGERRREMRNAERTLSISLQSAQ